MARSTEGKLLHITLQKGMDQSSDPQLAPAGTLYQVLNCRRRGPGGALVNRPGLNGVDSVCIGDDGTLAQASLHYITGNGSGKYEWMPCFLTSLGGAMCLGHSGGEAFSRGPQAWTFLGRFSSCLPVRKRASFLPNPLAPTGDGTATPFPPQAAVNNAGYLLTAARGPLGQLQLSLEAPADMGGQREYVQWADPDRGVQYDRVRALAVQDVFWLFLQPSGSTDVQVWNVTPSTGGQTTVSNLGVTFSMPTSTSYWDAFNGGFDDSHVYALHAFSDKLLVFNDLTGGSVTLPVGSGRIPVSGWVNPTTSDVWVGINGGDGSILGTDTGATVDTSSGNVLRVRGSDGGTFHNISVTLGFAVSKTTIRNDLNTGFAGAGLSVTASVVGTNQIQLQGSYVEIDTAGVSSLSPKLGFANAGERAFSGAWMIAYSAGLNTVVSGAGAAALVLLDDTLAASQYTAPCFGLFRGESAVAGDGSQAMWAVGVWVNSGVYSRGTYVGQTALTSSSGTSCFLATGVMVSKPDNWGRIWVLLDNGVLDTSVVASGLPSLLASRYALVRLWGMNMDVIPSGGPAADTVVLKDPPTLELVSEPYVSISQVLLAPDLSDQRKGDFFSPVAVGPSSMFFPVWAGLETVGGPASSPGAGMEAAGVLVQAQTFEYQGTEYEDVPSAVHRDHDVVQGGITVAGQPVVMPGQSAANFLSQGADPDPSAFDDGYAFASGAYEVGFLHPPFFLSVADGAASATPAAGTYLYKAVLQWVDQQGRLHRSEPSAPTSWTTHGSNAVQLVVPTTQFTQRQSYNSVQDVEVVLFRTVAGGTEFHETTMRASLRDTGNSRAFTFSDTLSDAEISSNGFLYTDGGVLPNTVAPSCRFQCTAEDRVWWGGLWDPTVIQCSKILVPQEPLQASDSDAFKVQLPREVTALAYMDGQVVAFAKDAIFLVQGDGPNDQGHGGFSTPRTLAANVGCIDHRSVVLTERGVLFQSLLGLHAIPRGFGPPEYVGAAVQDQMQPRSTPSLDISKTLTGAGQAAQAGYQSMAASDSAYGQGLVSRFSAPQGGGGGMRYGISPAAVVSDEGEKEDVEHDDEVDDTFGHLRGYSFEYRDPDLPGRGRGRQYGIMAQDLQRTPAGKSVLIRGPEGKLMVNTPKLTMLEAAGLASHTKRLDDVERRLREMEAR